MFFVIAREKHVVIKPRVSQNHIFLLIQELEGERLINSLLSKLVLNVFYSIVIK